jgi:hypothetical protein
MEHAIMCPQCNAPLAPHRFARSIVCSYCGTTVQLDEASVSAAIFHEALRIWDSPATYQIPVWVSIGTSHWKIDKLIAQGDISEVYTARRARWPTELAILKVLRERENTELFENEWDALQSLQRSEAAGADEFTRLIPQPIIHGDIMAGPQAGKRASLFRWASGFQFTFDEVMQAYPQGIPARASIWIWRRILEVLAFIHASGMVHGAVTPAHLLIQKNEHGVRLVGYSAAGKPGELLRTTSHGFESFYPQFPQSRTKLNAQADLAMSARCLVALLGGDPATATLPESVPAALAGVVQRIALSDPAGKANENAWDIREELGGIAEEVFGPPQFIPIVMPS